MSGSSRRSWSQVYCPHTAVDAAEGGLSDWLADIVTGDAIEQPLEKIMQSPPDGTPRRPSDPFTDGPSFILQPHPSGRTMAQPALKLYV